MTEMDCRKAVCFINGSLRGRKSSSSAFLGDVSRLLPDSDFRKNFVAVKGTAVDGYPPDTLRQVAEADAIVFVFPLYAYGLPGALMRLLEDYHRYVLDGNAHNTGASVYVVVNCGFPRADLTTGEAVRVVRNFCRRLSLNWRFAVRIGTGPIVALTRRVLFLDRTLKRAFADIAEDIGSGGQEPKTDYVVRPIIPEPIIRRIKEHYEKRGEMIAPRGRRRRRDS